MPLVVMVFSAFKPTAEILRIPPTFLPEAPTLDNFRTVLTEAPYGPGTATAWSWPWR